MDKQIDAIEETVNNVQMGDEAKITTLERQFNLAYADASRTENAINSFQRDFESSMTGKEIPKLRKKEKELSKRKWGKAGVAGAGAVTLAVASRGTILAGGAAVALIGGCYGFVL